MSIRTSSVPVERPQSRQPTSVMRWGPDWAWAVGAVTLLFGALAVALLVMAR
jgi:hypothetical protein